MTLVHPVHGDLGVFIRGKIDWVIDLEGDVARLADLKTASTHWMGQWSDTKAFPTTSHCLRVCYR